jgi:hypothetical protein
MSRAFLLLNKINETVHQAGSDIYNKLRVGDTIVDKHGAELPHVALNHGSIYKDDDGLHIITKKNMTAGTEHTIRLSPAEMDAIKHHMKKHGLI